MVFWWLSFIGVLRVQGRMSKLDSPDLAMMKTQLLTVSAACTLEAKLNQPFGRRTWPYKWVLMSVTLYKFLRI